MNHSFDYDITGDDSCPLSPRFGHTIRVERRTSRKGKPGVIRGRKATGPHTVVGCATEEGRPPGCALFSLGGMILSSTVQETAAVVDRTDPRSGTVQMVADPVASFPHQAEESLPLPDEPLQAWLWLLLTGCVGV